MTFTNKISELIKTPLNWRMSRRSVTIGGLVPLCTVSTDAVRGYLWRPSNHSIHELYVKQDFSWGILNDVNGGLLAQDFSTLSQIKKKVWVWSQKHRGSSRRKMQGFPRSVFCVRPFTGSDPGYKKHCAGFYQYFPITMSHKTQPVQHLFVTNGVNLSEIQVPSF